MITNLSRTLDNAYQLQELGVERLTLEPTELPQDIGKPVSVGSGGFLAARFDTSPRTISLRPDGNEDSPYEATTLYSAVQKALAIYPPASLEDMVHIRVAAGSYFETEAVVVPPELFLLSITGPLQYWVASFYLTVDLGPGSSWITWLAGGGEISDIYLDAQGNCDRVMTVDGGVSSAAFDSTRCMFRNGRVEQLLVDNGGFVYNIFGVTWNSLGNEIGTRVDNGSYVSSQICTHYIGESDSPASNTYYKVDNGSQLVILNDFQSGSSQSYYGFGDPTSSVFVEASNDSVVSISNGVLEGFDTVFKLFSGSRLVSRNVSFSELNTTINNDFADGCIWISSGDLMDQRQIDFTTLDYENVSSWYVDQDSHTERGGHLLGRLIIGSSEFPSESAFGRGLAKNIEGHLFLLFDGVNFTDFTADMNQDTSVPTSLFPALSSGWLYIGDSSKFSAINWEISTAVVLGTATIISEYWNGVSWVTLRRMNSNSLSPYNTYAENLWTDIGRQTVRLDITILQGSNWVTNSVNGETRYWIRIRVGSGLLTTSPVIDFIKLFSDCTIIKEDGQILSHGLSRGLKILPFHWSQVQASGSSAPVDTDVWYSTVLKLTRRNNQVANGRAVGADFWLPGDLDSSSPIFLNLGFISTSTAASQTWSFTLTVANVEEGSLGYTSSPAAVTHVNEQSIPFTLVANSLNGRLLEIQRIPFYLPTAVSQNILGESTQLIILNLLRTSAGGTDPIFVTAGLQYYSWRESGVQII